jgi:hypothetical protein
MLAVEQRHFVVFDEHGDNVQRGDCLSHLGFVGGEQFGVLDPARLVLKQPAVVPLGRIFE